MSREKIKEMTKILKDYTKKQNIMASVVILEDYAEEKAKAIAEHEQYIKTEYAREIFAEIETSLSIGNFKGSEVVYAIRAEDYLHYKKKYTEEKK